MKLSIIIPAVPSRFEKARKLFEFMQANSTDEVEILLLFDNKKRSIGKKREAILELAQGDYFWMVDDDDGIFEVYETHP